MDHDRIGQPTFTAGNNPSLHFHSTIPSLVSDVPFYMHNVLNPNATPPPLPHSLHDTTTVFPPLPPPTTYSPQTGWNGFTDGINLNQGTNNYAQSTTTIRWPRQETLALLEIRSRLDPCFKEATSSNHKAPLWDEISRIMNEEYGYQRSGRKCKEKFENLYKYYKKPKEGKVGKNDGKHYRFFPQLEAIFGDQQNTNTNIVVDPSSQSNNSSEYGTPPTNVKNPSCDYEFKKKDLITTIEESIELHLGKLMVKQEEWSKKIMCTIEHKEKQRVVLEEEWRKQEWARLDQEYEAWASHVACIKSRDNSLLESLQTLIRVRSIGSSYRNMDSKENEYSSDHDSKDWIEHEISCLIHIRTSKESKFQDVDQEYDERRIWKEVAFELSLLGYDRSVDDCKATWDKICVNFNKTNMDGENTSKDVSSRTSNTMNIDGDHSWETM